MNFIHFERDHFFSRIIWIFPMIFFFHIIEESAGFTEWATHTLQGSIDIRAFYQNNAAFMVILIGCTAFAAWKKTPGAVFVLILWVSGQQFWNFVFHLYTQFRFQAYSPGLFTAVFLYFPVYLYVSYLALRERFLSPVLWVTAFLFGSLGMAGTIWGGLYHFGPVPWDRWF